jgi:hypothetical protein
MAKQTPTTIPHDWTFANWPTDVFPYSGPKGRHVVKQNQLALLRAGALTRIGRCIVIFGAGYSRWLASNAHRVVEFEVAPNLPEHAAKRAGQAGKAAASVRLAGT